MQKIVSILELLKCGISLRGVSRVPGTYVMCTQTGDKSYKDMCHQLFPLPPKTRSSVGVKERREESWCPGRNRAGTLGPERPPLNLLVLGAVRFLGRGFAADNCAESTSVSKVGYYTG